jgi:hypothetical protein
MLTTALLATVVGCSGGGNSTDPSAGGATASGGSPPPPSPPPPPPSPPPILPPVTAAWHVPNCSFVTGAPISFTTDGGLHRAPIETPAAANYFTYGVVALSAGSTLAAIIGTTTRDDSAAIFFSTDAGCSWQPSGQMLSDVSYYLDAALSGAGSRAYLWRTNGRAVYVIEPTGIARPFSLTSFPYWVSGPYGIAIDPNDPTRIRIAMYDCMHRASCGIGSGISETTNEGRTWTQTGRAVPFNGGLTVSFSPTNLDHAIAPYGQVGSPYPTVDTAGYVTFDGGNQWLPGKGVATGWATRDVAIGPDGQTVWLLAIADTYPPPPTILAAMYVSYDGGLNYQEAFAASDENPFVPANPRGDPIAKARIFPHPSNADVVYLAYTSRADATSYLYRYDAALDQLTKQEWPSTEGGVWSLAFNPADPDLLYLGLSAAE